MVLTPESRALLSAAAKREGGLIAFLNKYTMKKTYITLIIIITSLSLYAQTFQWALNFGSSASDGSSATGNGSSIAIDANGFIYVTGNFQGSNVDFDPSGSALLSSAGGSDIFVAKYNTAGQYQWAFRVGGTGGDVGYQIATDASSSIYVTGYFQGTNIDFDPSGSAANLSSAGGSTDIFVAKYNSAGQYQWAFKIGGTDYDYGTAITINPSGEVFTSGYFQSINTDFDPGGSAANLSGESGYDLYLAKYNTSGQYQWAFKIGCSGYQEIPLDIVADNNNNAYITGWFSMTVDFDPSGSIANVTSNGGTEIFVAKYNSAGQYQWAFGVGGAFSSDNGRALATDAGNNLYVTGSFNSTADFDPNGTANMTSVTSSDIFIAKYNDMGQYQWAFQIPGNGAGRDITVDDNGYIYTTGGFQGSNRDFDPSGNTAPLSALSTWYDVYVAKYDNTGQYQWAFSMGSSGVSDYGYGIVVDHSCGLYLTGTFQNTVDFDGGAGTANLTSNGSSDVFVSQYSCAVLPVGLTAFYGSLTKENDVLLNWETISEINNSYFIIEKSMDGKIFEETGKVKGAAGNSSTTLNYNFIDHEPFSGTSYYRLKQVDYDGNFIYSKVISITIEQLNALGVDIYPNPANDIVTIDFGENRENMKTEVEIYDILERKILKFEIANPESTTSGKSEINISSLSKGLYFLKVTNGAGQTQTKFVKE